MQQLFCINFNAPQECWALAHSSRSMPGVVGSAALSMKARREPNFNAVSKGQGSFRGALLAKSVFTMSELRLSRLSCVWCNKRVSCNGRPETCLLKQPYLTLSAARANGAADKLLAGLAPPTYVRDQAWPLLDSKALTTTGGVENHMATSSSPSACKIGAMPSLWACFFQSRARAGPMGRRRQLLNT